MKADDDGSWNLRKFSLAYIQDRVQSLNGHQGHRFISVDGNGMMILGRIGTVKSVSLASIGDSLPDVLGSMTHGAESAGISQWLPPWSCLPAS